jgi:hypothetical protein
VPEFRLARLLALEGLFARYERPFVVVVPGIMVEEKRGKMKATMVSTIGLILIGQLLLGDTPNMLWFIRDGYRNYHASNRLIFRWANASDVWPHWLPMFPVGSPWFPWARRNAQTLAKLLRNMLNEANLF